MIERKREKSDQVLDLIEKKGNFNDNDTGMTQTGENGEGCAGAVTKS